MIMLFSEWDKQRSKLHHSWLLNKYVTFLKANKDLINSPLEMNGSDNDVLDQLLSWNTKKTAISDFINDADLSLSPRQLLNESPLDRLPEREKKSLAEVVHALFLQQSSISVTVSMLNKSFNEVDYMVALAAAHMKGELSSPSKSCGDDLLQKVLELSALISALPHSIQIPYGVT